MKNIVFLDSYTLNPGDIPWNELETIGSFTSYPRTLKEEVYHRAKEAHIIISNKVFIDADLIAKLPLLECICIAATGYNNIDLEAARSKSIIVCNVAGYSTTGVAQHVFALLLELCNQVGQYQQEVREGRWSKAADWTYWNQPILELTGLTMGVYGFGKIGQQVARIAEAFGMKLLVKHTRQLPGWDQVEWVDTETLFSESDVVSLHAPLKAETNGLVNSQRLALMKPNAYLINTGRGGLIIEEDLRNALLKEQIGGAALDVLSMEPPLEDHPLIDLPNCLITPHQAWASLSSRKRLRDGLIQNIKAFLEGKPINVLN